MSRDSAPIDWLVKLWPLITASVLVVGYAIHADGKITSLAQAQLQTAQSDRDRFERIEAAITALQGASATNAATVANLVTLVGRDREDIARLTNAAEAHRSTIAEIKSDVREVKTILQRMDAGK